MVDEMKKHLIISSILGIILLSGFSGCVEPPKTEYFNGVYIVNSETLFNISNINGQVEITGWEGGNVTINAVKKSSLGEEELNKVNINVSQTENHLEITTEYTGQKTIQASIDYNIKVPYNITIGSITTSNGAIQISKTKGDIHTVSSNGAILIHDVDGIVSATTSNGRIEIQGTTGISDLRTSNAPISAEILYIQNDTDIETSNGAISIYIHPLLNATLDMATSNGRIIIEQNTLDNISILQETHVRGRLGIGFRRITVHTSNANIYLHKLHI